MHRIVTLALVLGLAWQMGSFPCGCRELNAWFQLVAGEEIGGHAAEHHHCGTAVGCVSHVAASCQAPSRCCCDQPPVTYLDTGSQVRQSDLRSVLTDPSETIDAGLPTLPVDVASRISHHGERSACRLAPSMPLCYWIEVILI